MRRLWPLVVVAIGALMLAVASRGITDDKNSPPGQPAAANSGTHPADNSYCYVCHANLEDEEMVKVHQREGVGCQQCHGASAEHSSDEDNVTPPDKMYAKAKIDAACGACHDEHDVSAVKVIARWKERCAAKSSAKDIVCTDCHGQHRLTVRTRRWDKATGKLLSDDGVRMMESKAAGPTKPKGGDHVKPGL